MRYFIITLVGLSTCLAFACNKGGKSASVSEAGEWAIYRQALGMQDYPTAIYAVNAIIAKDTAQVENYDTLAILYYHIGNYTGAAISARIVLHKQPDNQQMLELMTDVLTSSERTDLAVPYLSRLLVLTKKLSYSYQLAQARYKNNEFDAAEKQANAVIGDPKSDSTKVNIVFGKDHSDKQMICLKAASYNLIGAIRLKQDKKAEAKTFFEKAIATQPNYFQAKENLALLNK